MIKGSFPVNAKPFGELAASARISLRSTFEHWDWMKILAARLGVYFRKVTVSSAPFSEKKLGQEENLSASE